jgi:hypothetical protein
MFERYTETARRVIFYSRYFANQGGSAEIETEHLLLGLLRADMGLANRFLGSPWAADPIWRKIEQSKPIREITPGPAAIANHDFAKARLCSEEERTERDKLRLLYQQHGLSDWIFD